MCAWTAPRTWTTGEIVTKTIGDEHWRDNLRFLKGLDGTVTLDDGLDLGTNELTVNSIEIVGTDGEVNKAAVEDHTHADAANCGTIDHGALTGKGDDDHTIYALRTIMTADGDIIYRASGVWTRLAKGAAGENLRMNVGGTAPEWAAGVATREIYVNFQYGSGCVESMAYNTYVGWVMGDATDNVVCNFYVPHDFTTITEASIVYIEDDSAQAAQTFDYTVNTCFATAGQASLTHTDTITADGLAVTEANFIRELDISAALTGIAADDYCGVQFIIDAREANAGVFALGVRLKYT